MSAIDDDKERMLVEHRSAMAAIVKPESMGIAEAILASAYMDGRLHELDRWRQEINYKFQEAAVTPSDAQELADYIAEQDK